tara:strand:- start:705 stop:3566 length:2862 start_codon:yes stop_codon:yes gene_type:complete
MRFFIFYFLFTSFLICQENYSELNSKKWVDSVYNSLSLEEKIGQLFVNWVSPEQSDFNQIEKLVVEQNVGGLIFSIGNPFSHIEWVNKYQSKAKTPLLIAMDAEWGPAMRLDDVFAYPWNMTLGAIQDNNIIKDISKRIAEQNKLLGIHYNFSPVVDVNSNPINPIIGNRSFGEDPENVYQKAKAYIEGHNEVGVITSLKHFPGHGDTSNDSHKTLPEIKSNLKRLNEVELYPFKKLIDDNIVSSIMAAHILYPSLDKKYPSSISKKIVKNLLKEKLGFNGIIVTDALDMQGVLQDPNINVDLRAFLVGNDILLMSTDVAKGIKSISTAYKKGQISENRLSSSVKKILKVKANIGEYSPLLSESILEKLNTTKDTLLYSKAMESATTLVKNKDDLIQLDPDKKYLHISFGENGQYFYDQLNKTHKVDRYNKETYELLFEKVDYDGLIITYQGSNSSPYNSYKVPKDIVNIINKIGLNNNVILNLFLNPYSLNSFTSIDNIESIVISYQNTIISQEVSADLIAGHRDFSGKLPVSTKFFPLNHGLSKDKKQILSYSRSSYLGVDSNRLSELDSLGRITLDSLMTPGFQMLVAKEGKIIYNKSFGHHTYDRVREVRNSDIYDLSSITKILASMPLIIQEYEKNNLSLETNLKTLFPKKKLLNKSNISLKDMLSHYARLRPWIPFYKETLNRKEKPKNRFYKNKQRKRFSTPVSNNLFLKNKYQEDIFDLIIESELRDTLEFKYSDLPFYLIKYWIEDKYKEGLDVLADERIFKKLNLKKTMFNPYQKISIHNVVPSEKDEFFRYGKLQGYVHDEGAAMLGGVSGHAGLFSNSYEVALMLQTFLQGGVYDGIRLFDKKSFDLFNYCYYCDKGNRSGAGFDKPQLEGKHGSTFGGVSKESFGHYGYTGSIAWADPDKEIIFVFLSNRTYPTRENTLLQTHNIRTRMQEIVYNSLIYN